MPSAPKKTKEILVNNQNMDGDDEPKQQLPDPEEGNKLESRSTVRSNFSERNPQKQVNQDEDDMHEGSTVESFVHVEWEDISSMEDFNVKFSTSDNDEESHDNSSSKGYSTSSSNDESHVLQNLETTKQIEYAPVKDNHFTTEAIHLVKKPADFVNSNKIAFLDYAIESNDGSSDDEKEKSDDWIKNIDSSYRKAVQVTDLDYAIESNDGSSDDEEKKAVDWNENIDYSHRKAVQETDVLDEEKAKDEIQKTAPSVDASRYEELNQLIVETVSVNVPSLEKIVHVSGSASVDNSVTSCEVVKSVSNGNGEKISLSMDEIAKIPSTVMDVGTQNQVVQSGSNEIGVKTNPSMDSPVESTYFKNTIIPMDEDESSLSLISSSGESAKSDNKNEFSDIQTLLDSAQGTVPTTSWKSCCGIFELFTSGNR